MPKCTNAERDRFQWTPPANQVFQVDHSELDELPDGVGLEQPQTSAPMIRLEALVTENPEVWADVSASVTITYVGVVDELDPRDESVVVLVDGGLQFRIEADVDGDPVPGEKFSIFTMANRADDVTLQVTSRTWLKIMPWVATP